MATKEVLRIEKVSAGYNKIPIIHDINLIMEAGETVAVVGANGAGKTTLLRTIMGQIRATRGSVSFAGAPLTLISTYDRARLGIGYVPEGRELFSAMSVCENIELGASRETAIVRASRASEMLNIFPKLKSLYRTQCGLLSGGEQQMVAIARALMGKPSLLLLDEPSTGLAPKVISELYATLSTLLDTGMTILVAEQNARAALRFAQRALVFEDGRIATSGLAKDLIGDARVVQAYVGIPEQGLKDPFSLGPSR